jgi:hypothetical protein
MVVYLFLIASLLFLSNSKKGILSFIILLLVSVLRDISVGTDTVNYLEIFENPDSFQRANDFIWVFINNFVLEAGLPFNYILFISSFIFLLMIWLTAIKMKVNAGLSLFYLVGLFYYFQSFNITRQSISISIVLYAFTFIKDKKIYLFLLFILLASGFHFSAVFVLPFYSISNKPQKPQLIIPLLFSSFILGGLEIIRNLFGKIEIDFIYNTAIEENDDFGFSLSRFLLNIFASYLVLNNKGTSLLINLFVVGVILLNILSPLGYASRFAYYFIIVQVILLPEYQLMSNKRLHIVSVIYALVIFSYLLYYNNAGIIPYKVSEYFF